MFYSMPFSTPLSGVGGYIGGGANSGTFDTKNHLRGGRFWSCRMPLLLLQLSLLSRRYAAELPQLML
jgi:hypothetical protein